jgi:hypothetical protein
MKSPKPPISQRDYEQIFRVVYSLMKAEKGSLMHACLYINPLAAALLIEHHQLDVQIHVGIAAYLLDEKTKSLLLYSDIKDNQLDPEGKNIHCWLEAGGWHIDFMAPLFPLIARQGNLGPCPSKAFCKQISDRKEAPDHLIKGGDFFAHSNPNRAQKEMGRVLAMPIIEDWAQICSRWYCKAPAKLERNILMGDQAGRVHEIKLAEFKIAGSW